MAVLNVVETHRRRAHAFKSQTYSALYVVFKSICPNQFIASNVVNYNGATGDAE